MQKLFSISVLLLLVGCSVTASSTSEGTTSVSSAQATGTVSGWSVSLSDAAWIDGDGWRTIVLVDGENACAYAGDASTAGGSNTTRLVLRVRADQTKPGKHEIGQTFQASITKFQNDCVQSIPDTEGIATSGSLDILDFSAQRPNDTNEMMGWLDLAFPRGNLTGFISVVPCGDRGHLPTSCSH